VHYDGLIAAVGRERYNVRERFGRGVLVTSIDETRELPIEIMIVAGLVEGEFPSPYLPEVFFSARRGRAREQKHIWENRYLFYQAVTNWTDRLFLTYPESEGDVELVRSTFVDSLFSVAKVRVWDRETPPPFAGDIASRSEFLKDYGIHVGQSPQSLPSRPVDLEKECEGVAEGVRVERSRMIGHDRPEYEGWISTALSPADADRLARLRHGVYSVSQLESYAGCPFQFFAKNLLRLDETREFEEEITPGEKGSVLHDILFEFFRSRRERGAPILRGCSAGEFEEALSEAVRIASTRLERLDISDVFWEMEKEWILGTAQRPGLLRRILEFERDRTEPVRPAFFEVTFGSPPSRAERSDPLLVSAEPVMLGSVSLRGRVDRVDIGDGFFSVMDYKTGSSVPGLKEIREGTSLQIPVYLHAVEQMVRAGGGTNLAPAGGFYLRLRDDVEMRPAVAAKTYQGRAFPAGARHRQFVADEKELREVIEGTRQAVEGCVGGIAEGRFPLTTADRVDRLCGHCPFRTMCRIQTLRHVKTESPEVA
jgi:ATP-dependent helicase/nuclease subunit B